MNLLKGIGVLIAVWLGLNVLALVINLLFSNLITGSITLLALFLTPLYLIYRHLTKD